MACGSVFAEEDETSWEGWTCAVVESMIEDR